MSVVKQFDLCAKEYEKLRPVYPSSLFQWIAKITPNHEVVLDCGAGNGQAAVSLAKHFKRVVAIDIGQNQINQAKNLKNLDYYCMPAEATSFGDKTFDLIVSACAVHWFDLDKFYREAKRLLKPEGRIIVWSYTWPKTNNELVSAVLEEVKNELSSYWSAGSRLHLNEYKTLPFPFEKIETPFFQFSTYWTKEELLGFFMTWACIRQHTVSVDINFLDNLRSILKEKWPDDEAVQFLFPIHIKAGKS